MTPPRHTVRRLVAALAVALTLAGCGLWPWRAKPPQEVPAPADMRLLAVLPIEPTGDARGATGDDAGMAVTAQIYRVLAEQTEFRFVADLAVSDVLSTPALRRAGDGVERAIALGKEVGADGVIFGRVSRFRKRVGTEFGASEPASVAFELGLVSVHSGRVVWQGDFDETQKPPASSWFTWWMFWRSPPRWMSASELIGTGVDRLFEEMTETVNASG